MSSVYLYSQHMRAAEEVDLAGSGQAAVAVNLWLEEAASPPDGSKVLPVTVGECGWTGLLGLSWVGRVADGVLWLGGGWA